MICFTAAAGVFHRIPPRVREMASCVAFIALAAVVLYLVDIGCLFRTMTGIPCPGCGMTRAWFAALRLNFEQAFAYHPLFVVFPVAFVLAALQPRLSQSRRRMVDALMFVILVALLVLWAVRLWSPVDAGLFFEGSVPVGMPGDIVFASKPVWACW